MILSGLSCYLLNSLKFFFKATSIPYSIFYSSKISVGQLFDHLKDKPQFHTHSFARQIMFGFVIKTFLQLLDSEALFPIVLLKFTRLKQTSIPRYLCCFHYSKTVPNCYYPQQHSPQSQLAVSSVSQPSSAALISVLLLLNSQPPSFSLWQHKATYRHF